MKPVQRSLGIGADHIETVGGVRATPASFILTEEAYGEATRTLIFPSVASLVPSRVRSESDM
jgi:hypothetical protein